MTVTTAIYGYLEDEYLNGPYGVSNAVASGGMQMRFVIADDKASAMQAELNIVNFLNSQGLQAELQLVDQLNEQGFQYLARIQDDLPRGAQSLLTILEQDSQGVQFRGVILEDTPFGLEFEGVIAEEDSQGLQFSSEIADSFANLGLQAELVIVTDHATGMQTTFRIADDQPKGVQFAASILDQRKNLGTQYEGILNINDNSGAEFRADKYPTLPMGGTGYLDEAYLTTPYLGETWGIIPGLQMEFRVIEQADRGLQAELFIKDAKKNSGVQMLFTITDYLKFSGVQFTAQNLGAQAYQFLAAIYNTTNLRILSDFSSRGLSNTNWTASSTEPGDFNVNNLDTDIVEQVWRSASGVVTGVQLNSDVGIPQGTIMDTLAILNHNLTTSATVTLLGSNNAGHSPVGVTIPLTPRRNNMYYIAPTLPSMGYRYWRFNIDDATNPAGFLSIGAIIFGSSMIFQGECFVDRVDFQLKDFADTVATEGFTNVANSRTLKRQVRLDFRVLEANRRNFQILRDIFENIRTTLKCLWIPTPSDSNQEVTAKFATFGKLSQLPSETHNSKGPNADYVDLTVEVDESL